MNIHLLPHKMANHNILATELLVEVTNMKKAPPMMHLGLVKDFWRFGVHSAILKSSLLNGIAHSLGHQHGVLGRDGGGNGYPTALPQEANPVISIPLWRPASVPALLYEWTNSWTGNFSWEADNAAGLKSVLSLFWQERSTHICQRSAMPLQWRLTAQIGIKMWLLRELLLLFCVDIVSALRFIQLNV